MSNKEKYGLKILDRTEEVIDELESGNPDTETIEDYAKLVAASFTALKPNYEERLFEAIQEERYDDAVRMAEAFEENYEELFNQAVIKSEESLEEEDYERKINATVKFLYETTGTKANGINWKIARERGVIQ
ncbi:hypothetical protein GLU60_02690 [Nanohaloarchaea archaeon H01]|nr:hypothetical protein [Nanohaloarchaea archaeon H01]